MAIGLKGFTDVFSNLGDDLLDIATGPVGDVISKVTLPLPGQIIRDVAATSFQGQQAEAQREVAPPMAYTYNAYEPSMSTIQESGGTIDIPSSGNIFEGGVGGALTTIGTGLIGGLLTTLGRSGAGGAVGGAVTGLAVGSMLNGSDACGCGPKQFVRADKCGRPIITRKMKKTLIEAVNCMGPEAAFAAYGIDAQLGTMIISKQFPARKMGISGAQLSTTMRTARKLDRAHRMMQNYCKKTPARRTR